MNVPANVPFELSFSLNHPYPPSPLAPVTLRVYTSSGELCLETPLYRAGDDQVQARISLRVPGEYSYELIPPSLCTAPSGKPEPTIVVVDYDGDNPLYRHGAPVFHPGRHHLSHADGTPFFWLADTWWYGATARCRWPDEFQLLVDDRRQKGFTVIQLVVGIPPEIPADHPAARNEGGAPFLGAWDRLNPAYFHAVDRRIRAIVDAGMVPCILGGWGYQVDWMGIESMQQYWAYLVARYGAYPVVWCLAGESDMLTRPSQPSGGWRTHLQRVTARVPRLEPLLRRMRPRTPAGSARALQQRRRQWQQIGSSVAEADPYGRILTTHPVPGTYAHESLNNASWVGLNAIQSGHAEHSRVPMVTSIATARTHFARPIINMEPWYEGILGQFPAEDQRYAFWACFLSGAAGHSYGAHGIWQMARDDGFLAHWGEADWQVARDYAGSTQLGMAARLLARVPWWQLVPANDRLKPSWTPATPDLPLAGAALDLALVYFPATSAGGETTWTANGPAEQLTFSWYDPRTGESAAPSPSGCAGPLVSLPTRPDRRDWLLIIRRAAHDPT